MGIAHWGHAPVGFGILNTVFISAARRNTLSVSKGELFPSRCPRAVGCKQVAPVEARRCPLPGRPVARLGRCRLRSRRRGLAVAAARGWIGGRSPRCTRAFRTLAFLAQAIFLLAATGLARQITLAAAYPRVISVPRQAADGTTGPHQLEWQEQPPGVVALIDRARDDVAGHRRGVEPVAAEAAGEPQARRELADLRHAMQRIAEHAGPEVLDIDRLELRIDGFDLGLERRRETARIALPRGDPARPHQPVGAHDPIMAVGELGVAHGAAIRDGLVE